MEKDTGLPQSREELQALLDRLRKNASELATQSSLFIERLETYVNNLPVSSASSSTRVLSDITNTLEPGSRSGKTTR